MALGIFKRKKEKVEKEKKEEKNEKEEKKVLSAKSKEKTKEKKESIRKKEKLAWKVIKEPHITEKATLLAERNEYVFKVYPSANKPEIKKAIEEIYGVKVEKVRIINVSRKKRRRGRVEGWKKGYKKAIVKVKEGQAIEILPR